MRDCNTIEKDVGEALAAGIAVVAVLPEPSDATGKRTVLVEFGHTDEGMETATAIRLTPRLATIVANLLKDTVAGDRAIDLRPHRG